MTSKITLILFGFLVFVVLSIAMEKNQSLTSQKLSRKLRLILSKRMPRKGGRIEEVSRKRERTFYFSHHYL